MSRQLSFVLNKNNNDDRQIDNDDKDDDNADDDVLYIKCVNNSVEINVYIYKLSFEFNNSNDDDDVLTTTSSRA